MMPSLLDLILPRASARLDEEVPIVGGSNVVGLVETALGEALQTVGDGWGAEYVRRAVSVLERPLPRVLVTAWRAYEPFLDLAADGSDDVDVGDHAVQGYWEVAPRFEESGVAGPVLVVTLRLEFVAGIVEVRDGRFTGLRAGGVRYSASVGLKGAPEAITRADDLPLPGGRLDFGRGWPVRPAA